MSEVPLNKLSILPDILHWESSPDGRFMCRPALLFCSLGLDIFACEWTTGVTPQALYEQGRRKRSLKVGGHV